MDTMATFRQMDDLDGHDADPKQFKSVDATSSGGAIQHVPNTVMSLQHPVGPQATAEAMERPSPLATFANRLMFSTWYVVVYLMLFLLQIVLLIWGIVNRDELINNRSHLAWYITLDVLITCVLSAEVILRLVATYTTYWRSWLNRIDFVVMCICILALFIWIAEPGSVFVDAVAVSFRYCVQLVRVMMVCKHNYDHRKMTRASSDTSIDFRTIDPSADPMPETLKADDVTGDAFDDRSSYASVEIPK